jgi:hypothetical protein
LSQINPVHTTQSYFCKIHLNIILPPTSKVFLVVSFLLAFSVYLKLPGMSTVF